MTTPKKSQIFRLSNVSLVLFSATAGATALIWGAQDVEIVRLLLVAGADVNARSKYGITALITACAFPDSSKVVEALLSKRPKLDVADADGDTPLVLAASTGNVATMQLLLKQGADPHFVSTSLGPLSAAAYFGNVNAVRLLLDAGVKPDEQVGAGGSALHPAVAFERAQIVELLISKGVNVNLLGNKRFPSGHSLGTPLMLAAYTHGSDPAVTKLLLAHGADVKLATSDGETALSRAQAMGASWFTDILQMKGRLHAVPWLRPDPQERLFQMSLEELAPLFDAIPSEVADRRGTSSFYPVQIPDLIGIRDRRYLDRTGLQQHRSIVDLMRYAALNQGADFLASHDGFIPLGGLQFRTLPDPNSVGGRYSDEQLYALALYLYSLQPLRNPNKFDLVAARGQKVFERESCHTPPLYTNNKLTPANGFTIPPDHLKKYDVLPISVGTDPNLTLKTRRGTGYYKVPSLGSTSRADDRD